VTERSGGVFVGRGVSLRLRNLQIRFGPDGPEIPPVTVELSLGMAPFWLEIALKHLAEAEAHHGVLLAAKPDDGQGRAVALEGEFCSGMQAIVAAATAIDALYAQVKPFAEIPDDVAAAWTTNGTARYKQVAEVLRRAFHLKDRRAANLRRALKETYRFRDWAVHPESSFSVPVLHPDLGAGTEWRFVAFGFAIAKQIVRAALAFTALLAWKPPEAASEPFRQVCADTLARIDPLTREWCQKYGQLTDDEFERRPA